MRQHFIHYLTAYRDCPPGLMAVEMEMQLNNMKKRADIVVHNREGSPLLIVECKAPAVGIAQSAFEQALRYYTALRPRYVVVSNGLKHYCLQVKTDGSYKLLEEIPRYGEMGAD